MAFGVWLCDRIGKEANDYTNLYPVVNPKARGVVIRPSPSRVKMIRLRLSMGILHAHMLL